MAITRESEMVIEENSIVDFAEQHFDKFTHAAKDCRWNGRQIRNAFQIASSLARYEHFAKQNSDAGESGDNSRDLYLGARHFKQVEKATVEYDDFRSKMLGFTDSELALHKMERGPELVRRPGPQHGAYEHHRATAPPSSQRASQYMSAVPPARDRGGGRGGQHGRGRGRFSQEYEAGYGTQRQQAPRAPPSSYDRYGADDVDRDYEDDGAEPGDYEHGGEQNVDEASYPDTY